MLINQAVILCGGLGKRISSITKRTPKPLIKVNGMPVVEHIIKNFARFGISEILLLCGYRSHLFKDKYHNKIFFGIKIKCIVEKKPLGTSGALYNSRRFLKKYFILCNGDTFFDININDLVLNFFKKKKLTSFIALKKMKKNIRYDSFDINKKNLLSYNKHNKSFYINSGICVFNKNIIKYLSKIGSLEKKAFPILIKKKKLFGKVYHNDFIDMGIYKDLNRLPKFLKKIYFKSALFLDRDGVINRDIGYLHKINDFVWKPNIIKFIKKYNDLNFYVFVITNQSGIGRGYYKEKDVKKLHHWISNKVRLKGGNIDEFFFAPYFKQSKIKKYRQNYKLRKPNIGMIKLAAQNWSINLKKSFLIGDNVIDKQTAKNAGIKCKIISYNKKLIF
jgi:D-glycero-D-manno-heptose 1,7-bisphosphate phosphatase